MTNFVGLTAMAAAQSSQHADRQQHKQTQADKSGYDSHHDGVNKRGDQAGSMEINR